MDRVAHVVEVERAVSTVSVRGSEDLREGVLERSGHASPKASHERRRKNLQSKSTRGSMIPDAARRGVGVEVGPVR
jgi:hypothetical protein